MCHVVVNKIESDKSTKSFAINKHLKEICHHIILFASGSDIKIWTEYQQEPITSNAGLLAQF